jgi:hypothetical protein
MRKQFEVYSVWQMGFQDVQNVFVKSKFHFEIHYPQSSRWNKQDTVVTHFGAPKITQHRGDCRAAIWMSSVPFVEFHGHGIKSILDTRLLLKFLFLLNNITFFCTPRHRYLNQTHQLSKLYMYIQCNRRGCGGYILTRILTVTKKKKQQKNSNVMPYTSNCFLM